MTTIIRHTILVSALTTLTACAAEQNAQPVSLRSIHQSAHCGSELPGVRWLSHEDLTGLLNSAGAGQHWNAAPVVPAPVADDEKWVMVSLGQKNSGGYSVALANAQADVRGQVVHLPLDIQRPAPDSMQTMQMTTPCIVIGLRGENYQTVSAESLGSVTVDK